MRKIILAALLISSSAFGGQCDHLYPNGVQIKIPDTIELCNSFYVVAYSKRIKGPLVSFERFDPSKPDVPRKDSFRMDKRIPPEYRANLGDYLNSGNDRGHLTPAADATTLKEMRDTFLLSNMTPQAKKLNRVQWKALEDKVRKKAKGITYIATGAGYAEKKLGKNKIGVPAGYYKIAWYSNGVIEAYTADNRDDAKVIETNINDVNRRFGTKFELGASK